MTARGRYVEPAAAAAGFDEAEIRAQLERVVESSSFGRAPRMRRFLAFLVDETLAGRSAELKEYTIATEVFDKPVDFEPGTSAVVRVEAGRLRRLLDQYHLTHGSKGQIQIDVPKGSYVPSFSRYADLEKSSPDQGTDVPPAELPQSRSHIPDWLSDERRLVTVLSCALADDVTAEEAGSDMLTLLDALYEACARVAARHGGEVDASSSDRLMVYFGWPSALEDAPGRALTAALEMVSAAQNLTVDQPFSIRIGVATSNAITRGPSEAVARLRPAVSGEAPSLASRMQLKAPPWGIMVAESTRRLSGGAFRFVPTGQLGPGEPDALTWRLLGAQSAKTRFRARHADALEEIVGRDEEIALLMSRWRLSCADEGQAAILLGEAGIGKSRLAEAVMERIGQQGHRLRAQCSPHHSSSALFPIIELIKARLGLSRETAACPTSVAKALARLRIDSDVDQALLLELLSGEALGETSNLLARDRKRLTFALLVQLLVRLSEVRPLALLVEDVHWADPTTVELLHAIVAAGKTARLFVLMTSRPDDAANFAQNNVTSVRLARLPRKDCNTLIDRMIEAAKLPSASRALIMDKAEGIPLFVEELTKLVLASSPAVSTPAVPESLSDLLVEQLDRLGPARRVAQIASVIGRTFSREMLAATANNTVSEIDGALDQLLAAGVVVRGRSDAQQNYEFRHALLRDAAYRSLLDSTRRALHLRLANVTLEIFPQVAVDQPEMVAQHLLAGGKPEESVPFWVDASRMTANRYALAEAATHLRTAIAALNDSPSADTRERELALLIDLGLVVRTARGYSDEELLSIYQRAHALAAELGRSVEYLEAVYGLWTHAAGRGQWRQARELAEEFERRAQEHGWDDEIEIESLRLLGVCDAFVGALDAARERHERAFKLYDPARHKPRFGFAPGVVSAAYLSWILLLLDRPEDARSYAAEALAAAEATQHPPTLAMALSYLIFHAVMDANLDAIESYNRRLQTICAERDTRYWQPFGQACAEWGAFVRDQKPRRLERLLELTDTCGELYLRSCLYLLAARMCLTLGRADQGLELVERATAFAKEHHERFWEADALCLKAALLMQSDPSKLQLAIEVANKAVEVAKVQGAVRIERKARKILSDLMKRRGGAGYEHRQQVRELAREFERSPSQFKSDGQIRVESLRLLGACDAFMGNLESSRKRHELAVTLYDPARHKPRFGFDPGPVSAAYLSWTLLLLGDEDEARNYAAKALATAEAASHPPTLAMVLSWLIFHAVSDGNLDAVDRYNEQLKAVCAERDTRYWQPFGAACAEWAGFERDRNPRRLERLLPQIGQFQELYLTSCLFLLAARMCRTLGRADQGLDLVQRAMIFAEEHDERFWIAEALCVKAQLLEIANPKQLDGALSAARQAIDVAKSQGAVQIERKALKILADLTEQTPVATVHELKPRRTPANRNISRRVTDR